MITNITDSVQVLKVRIYNKQIFAIAETDKKVGFLSKPGSDKKAFF